MSKSSPIKTYRSDGFTDYYLAGRRMHIPDIGEFAEMVKHREDYLVQTFRLGAITAEFVYYVDGQADDASNTVMLDREEMKLISDNYFAANDLFGLLADNDGLLWLSPLLRYTQKEQFTRPERMTPEIKQLLRRVNTQQLSAAEKKIYDAYQLNGPVRYSKAASLIAVINSDIRAHSEPILAIIQAMRGPALTRQPPPAPKPRTSGPPGGKGL